MKLKLHQGVPQEQHEARTLVFPTEAVREMPCPKHRGRYGPAQEELMDEQAPPVMHHPELVRQIEATLDHMQKTLDGFSEQLENYRFPTPTKNDPGPSRAA